MVALGLVAFSGHFGRAHPVDNYRPALPPAALSTGCWPLPAGLRFDFPFQVRSDGDVATAQGRRRQLLMQFDVIDVLEARAEVRQSFVDAGFVTSAGSAGERMQFHKRHVGMVGARVTALEGVDATSVVQGTITLDLPAIEVQSGAPVCSEPFATKRFLVGE